MMGLPDVLYLLHMYLIYHHVFVDAVRSFLRCTDDLQVKIELHNTDLAYITTCTWRDTIGDGRDVTDVYTRKFEMAIRLIR